MADCRPQLTIRNRESTWKPKHANASMHHSIQYVACHALPTQLLVLTCCDMPANRAGADAAQPNSKSSTAQE